MSAAMDDWSKAFEADLHGLISDHDLRVARYRLRVACLIYDEYARSWQPHEPVIRYNEERNRHDCVHCGDLFGHRLLPLADEGDRMGLQDDIDSGLLIVPSDETVPLKARRSPEQQLHQSEAMKTAWRRRHDRTSALA